MSNLVIVESPAKAKTIKKYLGKDYDVMASMGHIRDLPEKRLSVDVKNDFKPKYEIINGKEKLVQELKDRAKKSSKVFLATDPDREGEAISWHLSYILDLDLENHNRVAFNEITKNGVQSGMSNPRKIDIDLVNAQQARRILDRLVGYKLSPFLCKKIHKGLSGGRVQSVAVRIIVDREEEIRKFKKEEYWSIEADFLPKGGRKHFTASFYGEKEGQKEKKIEIKSQDEAQKIVKDLENENFVVSKIKKGKRKRAPAPPFTTSTLQQEASRKLGFQAKRTMKVAQELYEGVELPQMGATGLITYMRTDSLRISEDAIKEISNYIAGTWGDNYLPKKPRVFKTKAGAQDGHEAIRPTMPSMHPDKVKDSLSRDQYRLYKLIWERFTACQMSDCIHNTTNLSIDAGKYLFKASGYTVEFDGFTVLYTEGSDTENKEKETMLPNLEEGMPLNLKALTPNQHFTQPPPRYTEASLIKALEQNGIGRPSTYAPTISTITSRQYVEKENKTLVPTELGEVVTKLMEDKFSKIVNLKFTAQMEEDLDTIADGKNDWVNLLKDFYTDFDETLKKATEEMQGVKIHLEEDKVDMKCEKCGKDMVIKYGRYGKFIGCSGFPECKNIKSIVDKPGSKCPKCGKDIVVKRSRKGRVFYGCEGYPECDFVSWDEPLNEKCPNCGQQLFKKNTKKSQIYCAAEGCGYIKEQEK